MNTWILMSIGVFTLLVIGLGIYVFTVHTPLTQLETRYRNRFDRIDIHLRRRHNLLSAFLEAVEDQIDPDEERVPEAIRLDQGTLPEIEKASERPGDPEIMQNLEDLENRLTNVLEYLKNVVKEDPDLNEGDQFAQLLDVITETEEKIAFACEAYNEDVAAYNEARNSFPPVLFASLLGHAGTRRSWNWKTSNRWRIKKTSIFSPFTGTVHDPRLL